MTYRTVAMSGRKEIALDYAIKPCHRHDVAKDKNAADIAMCARCDGNHV
ncbi:MAG: hypothetical protein MZU97_26685 [Bacillus subtilis]|nr:hypothetical protein [Bacillus subtilis]